ncbi:MAG: hypothetical protein ACKO2L_14265, partial [Planctomycetaceae bacterium]
RNIAGGFRPSAQPHGGSLRANGLCHHRTSALTSARTFGAKQRRGLPPIRSAAWRQPAGKRPLPTSRQRARQRGHLRCKTQPGASAHPLSRMAAACGQTAPADVPPTRSPARAPSVRNTAGGFRPSAQPHGGSLRANGLCHRCTIALASAGTFGAKRSRGLPPNR